MYEKIKLHCAHTYCCHHTYAFFVNRPFLLFSLKKKKNTLGQLQVSCFIGVCGLGKLYPMGMFTWVLLPSSRRTILTPEGLDLLTGARAPPCLVV